MLKKDLEVPLAKEKIACPCCNNRRLFDAEFSNMDGEIDIKCPTCKVIITVSFRGNRYNTLPRLKRYQFMA